MRLNISVANYHEKNEIQVFFSRNKINLSIVVVCIILYIKHTQAPFLWHYNWFTSILFLAPSADSVRGAFFEFIYNLSIAYLTSLVFYLIVDYFPKRKKENVAFMLATRTIEMIDMQINQLFSFMMFIADMEGNLEKLKLEDYSKLVALPVSDRSHFCNTMDLNLQTKTIEMQGSPDVIHEFYSLQNISRDILIITNDILSQPFALSLEDSILEDLELIKGSRLLVLFATSQDETIKKGMELSLNYTEEDIFQVIATLQNLRNNKYPKHRFTTEQASEDEIERATADWKNFQEEHPEIIDFYKNAGLGEKMNLF